jgi:hypothetical protein
VLAETKRLLSLAVELGVRHETERAICRYAPSDV